PIEHPPNLAHLASPSRRFSPCRSERALTAHPQGSNIGPKMQRSTPACWQVDPGARRPASYWPRHHARQDSIISQTFFKKALNTWGIVEVSILISLRIHLRSRAFPRVVPGRVKRTSSPALPQYRSTRECPWRGNQPPCR